MISETENVSMPCRVRLRGGNRSVVYSALCVGQRVSVRVDNHTEWWPCHLFVFRVKAVCVPVRSMEEVFLRDEKPMDPGWYVTVTCWDSNEGGLPGVNFWNGEKFISGEPITSFRKNTFGTGAEARSWLDAHYDEVGW